MVDIAREVPEAGIDMPFLMGTIPYVQRLVDAFRHRSRIVYSSGSKPPVSEPCVIENHVAARDETH
jgi:hypothetical protein